MSCRGEPEQIIIFCVKPRLRCHRERLSAGCADAWACPSRATTAGVKNMAV